MPMSFFYVPESDSGNGAVPTSLVRFGICKEAATIDEAAERLSGFVL